MTTAKNKKTKLFYRTPTGEKTVECDRYETGVAGGINGPYTVSIYQGTGDDEKLVAAVSRVTEFEVLD